MATFSEVGPAEAKELLSKGEWIVLDARDMHSFREGHIDGAVLVHEGLKMSLIRNRKTPKPVMVYCYLGNSSRDLAQLLASTGYPEVYSLAGGFVAWKKYFEEQHN